ncbi:MAG TPA: hypothetical protein DCG32_00435 [Sphaerochaeta sp.]|jgi:hypothetical protein|nr:hypothetical protein [Sphaerochaeta sp.]
MVIQYEGNIGFQMQEMLTSLSQDSVSEFVIAFLKRYQIPYRQNSHDIFYYDHPNSLVISCSLDEVTNLEEMSLLYQLEWDNNPLSYIGDTITEDDEFGVFLQLKMLQKYPNLNFVFSRNEKGPRDLKALFIGEAVTLV